MSFYPFLHCFDFTAEFLLTHLYPASVKPLLSVHSAIKREARKVKGIRLSLSSCFPVLPGKPPEFQYLCLFLCKFQSILSKAFFQSLLKHFRFIFVLKATYKIITVSYEITFSLTLPLYDYVKPVIQYIMQIYICKERKMVNKSTGNKIDKNEINLLFAKIVKGLGAKIAAIPKTIEKSCP